MRINSLLFCTTLFFIGSCSQKQVVVKWENGNVKIARFPTSEQTYLEKTYFENGQLWSETEYKNGKRNGKSIDYYRNGKILGTVTYINDSINGHCIEYHPNGNLMFTGVQKMGKLIGLAKRYHPNGMIRSEELYVNNLRAEQHEWDSLGNKIK